MARSRQGRFGPIYLLAVWCSLLVAACNAPGATPSIDDGFWGRAADGGKSCGTPTEGCACDTEAQTVDCGEVQRVSGGTVFCSQGKRSCNGGVWGVCLGDRIAPLSTPISPPTLGLHPQNLGATQACVANPCDPFCNVFVDNAVGLDAGADSGLAVVDGGLSLIKSDPPAIATCSGLAVSPSTQTVTVTDLANLTTSPATPTFTAGMVPLNCFAGTLDTVWGVSAFDRAVATEGQLKVLEPWASDFTISAYAGSRVASANVQVRVDAHETALAPAGTASSFAGSATAADNIAFLYPYPDTVFPVGLTAPLVQWDNHGTSAQAVKVSLRYPTTGAALFSWSAIVSETNPPQFDIPQYAWSALDTVARGNDVLIGVQRLVAGSPRQESTVRVHFAPRNLRGQIFYTRYPANGGNASVMRVTPTVSAAAENAYGTENSGCVPCHSVSTNGRSLIHSNWGTNGTSAGGYSVAGIDPDGTLTRITGAPDSTGGDSRGLSYSAITPDGQFALQTANWWGNTSDTGAYVGGDVGNHRVTISNKIWQVSTTPNVLSTDVSGSSAWSLSNAAIMMPAFSPDGTKLVAVDGDRTYGAAWRQGLHTWNFNETGRSFSGARSFANLVSQDQWVRWPTFESDSRTVLYQAASGAEDPYNNVYGGGLPAGGCCGSATIHGKIWSVDSQAVNAPVYLRNLNNGLGAADADWDYQPTVLPVSVGGYRWAVFTSVRQYGNKLNNSTHPSPPYASGYTKQLWVSALDDTVSNGVDRSHPGFWLPGQETDQTNERAYWVLGACRPTGTTSASECVSNEDCCGGLDTPATSFCKVDQPIGNNEAVWVDDALPTGAVPATTNDSWYWYPPVNPTPYSGTSAHQSNASSNSEHQHYFYNAPSASQLRVRAGDTLFAYVYLDPTDPPTEVMLQWNDGGWEHRGFWGANSVGFGSRIYQGPLPSTGSWVRLEVAASDVGLVGSSLQGMAFTLWGGRATWDRAGIVSAGVETVWVDDAAPNGATLASDGGDSWTWIGGPTPMSGNAAHRSGTAWGVHQHYFSGATQTLSVSANEKLYAYVWLDPNATPGEVMLQWHDTSGSWEHRAYWGVNGIGWGNDGTVSRRYMGDLPASGAWTRFEVPSSQVGLAGGTVDGMAYTLYNGNAAWDKAGKTSAQILKHCTVANSNVCAPDGQECTLDSQCCSFPDSKCISGKCVTPPQIPYYTQATFTRDYSAVCPVDKAVRWRFLDWKTITPGDSHIEFRARTAITSAQLATASDVNLGTVTGAPITDWTGTDVDARLVLANQSSQAYLRVTVILTPTTDGTAPPVLTDWRQLYDCVDAK